MLAGTHIVFGAAIYRLAESKPWWIRWPAVVAGGFGSHYLLDSITTYHSVYGSRFWPWDNHWWPWYNIALIAVQVLAVCMVWLIGALEGRSWSIIRPTMLLSGLWAWLSWDWERMFGVGWLHVGSAQTWAPRPAEWSRNPWTALWEVGLVLVLVVLISKWRRRSEATAVIRPLLVPGKAGLIHRGRRLPVETLSEG